MADGDRVADAVAWSAEEVVVNTPEHGGHPLAVLTDGGRVARRFGVRRRGRENALDAAENTWRLAVSPRDRALVGVAAFRSRVAAWQHDGTPLWERPLASPHAQRLAARQEELMAQLRREPTTGCVAFELVRVGRGVEVGEDGAMWVLLGEAAAMESLAADGSWREAVPVRGEFAPAGGLVLTGPVLLTWRPDGVDAFRLQSDAERVVVAVEDERGQPVAAARVEVAVHGGPVWTDITDAAGRAAFTAPPSGSSVTLTVTAPSHRRGRRVGEAPEVFSTAVRLERADVLCAVVRSASDGKPVTSYSLAADATVEGLNQAGVEEGQASLVEDENGRGCVEALFPYPVTLRVAADGYATWRGQISAFPEGDVEVELQPPVALAVTVTDERGRPVEGAQVTVWPAETVERTARTVGRDFGGRTDERGELHLSRVLPGRYRASVHADGFLTWDDGWMLEAGPVAKRVTLRRGARVTVSVTARPGATPVTGADVELTGLPDASQRLACVTGRDGQCVLDGVPPGSFTVVACAAGRSPAQRRIHVATGQRALTVQLLLGRGVRVEGQVRRVAEYPDVSFVARLTAPGVAPAQVPLGQTGQFAFEDIPPGRVQVWLRDVRAGGTYLHRVLEIPEEGPTHEVTLELPPPVRLLGEVHDGDVACVRCRAVLSSLGADVLPPRVERLTDGSGRFEARLPRPGTWRAEVFDAAGALGAEEVVAVSTDQEHVFTLGRVTVHGRVIGEDGRAVPRAWVRVFAGHIGRVVRETTSGPAGDFRVPGLPAGHLASSRPSRTPPPRRQCRPRQAGSRRWSWCCVPRDRRHRGCGTWSRASRFPGRCRSGSWRQAGTGSCARARTRRVCIGCQCERETWWPWWSACPGMRWRACAGLFQPNRRPSRWGSCRGTAPSHWRCGPKPPLRAR